MTTVTIAAVCLLQFALLITAVVRNVRINRRRMVIKDRLGVLEGLLGQDKGRQRSHEMRLVQSKNYLKHLRAWV